MRIAIMKTLTAFSLADLGGVPGTRPPRVQILSFRHTKFSKRNRLGSARPPPPRGSRPLPEILDPPLILVQKKFDRGCNESKERPFIGSDEFIHCSD